MLFCTVISVRNKQVLLDFGTHLRQLREDKGFSQEQLANYADVSLSQISRIERGVINPTLCTLVTIADALGILPTELINFKK